MKKLPHQAILLRRSFSPTDDLYFLSPLESDLTNGDIVLKVHEYRSSPIPGRMPVQNLLDGKTIIVSRYCSTPWLRALTRHRDRIRKIIYLVDDDLPAAIRTPELPPLYRLQLAYAAYRHHSSLVDLSDRIAVCSSYLETRLPTEKTDLLAPPLIWPLNTLTHFDLAEVSVKVGFHGTAGHQYDLSAIARAITGVHNARPQAHFELVTSGYVPSALAKLERISVVQEKSWHEYKHFSQELRYHILLVPLMDTPFNRGKSHLKVLDAARFGAAGLFSDRAPYSSVIQSGENGVLVPDSWEAWQHELLFLIDNPSIAKQMALLNQSKAQVLGELKPLRDYWLTQLRE